MSDSIMDINNEEFIYWMILVAFFENKQQEWDKLRNIEKMPSELVHQEYTKYFEDLFHFGIPEYHLQAKTHLYRARQIKSDDRAKLGVNIQNIADSYYKVILTDEEIEMMNSPENRDGIAFTLQHFFMMKTKRMMNYTEDQQKEMSKIIEENSVPKIYGFSEPESRVPPIECRKAGRLNTINDAYLYLAFDRDTAIHEMRPSIGQQYSLAEFCTNKRLKFADFTGKGTIPPTENISLSFLCNKISEPNTDNNDKFYRITQHMAHMIHDLDFDGIIYKSALKKDENNILLFDEKAVDFIASEIVAINNVNIDYSTILPLTKDIYDHDNIIDYQI